MPFFQWHSSAFLILESVLVNIDPQESAQSLLKSRKSESQGGPTHTLTPDMLVQKEWSPESRAEGKWDLHVEIFITISKTYMHFLLHKMLKTYFEFS